jgi:hypothetical protein
LGEPYVARFDSASGFEGVYPVDIPIEDANRYIVLTAKQVGRRKTKLIYRA